MAVCPDGTIDPKTGEVKRMPEQYTITGLALAMGFSSRQELYDYSTYEGFEDVTNRARLKVEYGYEKRLQKAQCVGAIFALKNMGWRDERHVEVKGDADPMNGAPQLTIDWTKLDTATLGGVFAAMTQQEKPDNVRPKPN